MFQVIGQTEEGREKVLFPQKWPIRMHASSSTPDQTEAWVRQVLVLNFLNFLLTCPSAAPTLRQPDRCVRRVCARPAATHTHTHTHPHFTHTRLSVRGSPHPELPASVYSSHTRSGTSSAARCWPDSPFQRVSCPLIPTRMALGTQWILPEHRW